MQEWEFEEEFNKKFVCAGYMDNACPEDIKAFIQAQIDKAREEVLHTTAETIDMVIGTIALDQGWEETGDKYRKMYGLPMIYVK